MTGTNYQKFINIFSPEFDALYAAILAIKGAIQINSARGQSLDNIGSLLDYDRTVNELDSNYRDGVKNIIKLNTTAGTKPAIKQFLSQYLRISESSIQIKEETPKEITIQLPPELASQEDEIRKIAQRFIVAGVHANFVFAASYWDNTTWDNTEWS